MVKDEKSDSDQDGAVLNKKRNGDFLTAFLLSLSDQNALSWAAFGGLQTHDHSVLCHVSSYSLHWDLCKSADSEEVYMNKAGNSWVQQVCFISTGGALLTNHFADLINECLAMKLICMWDFPVVGQCRSLASQHVVSAPW